MDRKNKPQEKMPDIQDNLQYPPEEDITHPDNKFEKVDLNPEELANSLRISNELANDTNNNNQWDEPLDIPGAELDDSNEAIGSEDEENNYYSLGGERHENLEESEDI